MTEGRSYDAPLERLLHDLEDGNLSPEGWRKLEERLKADPEARRKYREHMAFASALHAEARAVGEIEDRTPRAEKVMAPRRIFARSVLAAAAVLALLAAVASWIMIPKPDPARVVAGPSTSWYFTAGGIDDGGEFIDGSRVSVDTGTLEMVSTTGTRVLLEAPADFEWQRPLRGELHAGQAWFAVARGDEGFKVRLGAVDVTDLGTEFGLRRRAGADEVHVGVGRVRVESIHKIGHAVELQADEAVVAGPTGRTRGAPCRPESFVRQLPVEVPMIRWSFDESKDSRFEADAAGLPAFSFSILDDGGKAREPVVVAGRFGGALDLGASGFGARSEFPGFSGGVPRTVAIWIRGSRQERHIYPPTGRDMHPSIVRWGRDAHGGKWQLAVGAAGELVATQWGGAWRSGRVPAGRSALDEEWHHVASVFTGRYLEGGVPEVIHYLDGERLEVLDTMPALPIDTVTDHAQSWTLSLGIQDVPGEDQPPLPDIALDELLLLRHALDDAQVRTLYQTNEWRPEGRPNSETPTEP